MRRILLINPNISQNTTDAMLAIARTMLPPDFEIVGATARRGARMIMDPSALALSVEEVVGIGRHHHRRFRRPRSWPSAPSPRLPGGRHR